MTDLRPLLTDSSALPRSTPLTREPGLRTILLHLKSGETIPEHRTAGAIAVHCLKGEVSFTLPDKTVTLNAGVLISVAPGLPHSLTASEESLLLVTISEQTPA